MNQDPLPIGGQRSTGPVPAGQEEAQVGAGPGPRMVPVHRPPYTPTVTYGLLAITIAVFLAQIASQSLLGFDLPANYGLKDNSLIAQGQFWRLFTPMLLHGSLLHIGFNMYALYVLGPGLERYYGHRRFLAVYLLSGFAGNVASLMFSVAPSLGSSTAIFGLLGAQGAFVYQNRKLLGPASRRVLNNIITIAVINLVIGLSPQIDNWGHIGGLIGGTLFAWLGGPLLQPEGIYPVVSLTDTRSEGDIIRAGVLVGLVFILLAAATLYLRGG